MTDNTINKKTCLFCAFWKPEEKILIIFRKGGACTLRNKDTRLHETCWGWKICSPNQLETRKKAGLIEEVDANG